MIKDKVKTDPPRALTPETDTLVSKVLREAGSHKNTKIDWTGMKGQDKQQVRGWSGIQWAVGTFKKALGKGITELKMRPGVH